MEYGGHGKLKSTLSENKINWIIIKTLISFRFLLELSTLTSSKNSDQNVW
jgi:hypothetical protein